MPRIPDADLTRWKQSADLLALMRADGMALVRNGRDWVCRCPFHDDQTPSLRMTPKGGQGGGKPLDLWNCPACHTGGDALQWLIKHRRLSFRAAVELLRESAGAATAAPVAGHSGLPCPLHADMDKGQMLSAVLTYYHERLMDETAGAEARAYLTSRGLGSPLLWKTFALGVADRTLGLRLPVKQVKDGLQIRTRLIELGLYRGSGHEHLNGCAVFPIRDAAEVGRLPLRPAFVKAYGRVMAPDLRRNGGAKHLYLPGQHAGVLNPDGYALAGNVSCGPGHLILCEAPIDALTLWASGIEYTCSAWGTGGFTADHLQALKEAKVNEVRIAFDRDDAGESGARRVAEQLRAEGIACYRVELPRGLDVNAYALKFTDPEERAEALKQAIRCAAFVHGTGGAGPPPCPPLPVPAAASPAAVPAIPSIPAAPAPRLAAPSAALPIASLASAMWQVEHAADFSEVVATVQGERIYRARGLPANTGPERLRVSVKVWRKSNPAAMHADALDLSQARARASFIAETAREIGESDGVIKADIAKLFGELETMRDGLNAERDKPRPHVSAADAMPEDERAAALALLRSPDLLARIVSDFAACGVVGEETNKLVGYLAATSRLLPRPLAIVVQSSSAAGKTSLLDAVLAMMPDEAQVRYSAMTGQSLYYMGGESLKHKILAIAEEEGAEQASYSLKLLQSEGKLAIATPSKDAQGQIKTERYEVEGPCAIFLTTTAADVDEELLNRCLVLTVDEDREQTKRIHEQQRKAETLEGLKAQVGKARILKRHANAQRLLEPLKVVNPFAEKLTFLDGKTRTRRDHPKYLALIRVIALLHQHQRPRLEHTDERTGEVVAYIEATRADIAAANRLMGEVLGRSLDELPPQSRRLLGLLWREVKAQADKTGAKVWEQAFTRREVRGWSGWTDPQVRKHLDKLAEAEYVTVRRGGGGFVGFAQYALLYNGEAEDEPAQRFALGLIQPEDTATADMRTPQTIHADPVLTPGCPPIDPILHGEEKAVNPDENHPIIPLGVKGGNKGGAIRSVVVEPVIGGEGARDQGLGASQNQAARASFLAASLAADGARLGKKIAALACAEVAS